MQQEGYGKIWNTSYVRRSNLPNVIGRINYISNPRKQEFLEDYYNMENIDYWKQLANQSIDTKDYNKNKVDRKGKAFKPIQAVEYIVRLSPEMYDKANGRLIVSVKDIAENFYHNFGYKCCVGVHHSKKRDKDTGEYILDERGNYKKQFNNLHCHIIICDREEPKENIKKYATRDIYFDSTGKRVYKKSLADPSKTIKKGDCYKNLKFGSKIGIIRDYKKFNEMMHDWSNVLNNTYSRYSYFYRPNNVGYNKTFEAQKKIGNNRPPKSVRYIREYNRQIRRLNAVKRIALDDVYSREPEPYYGFRYDNEQLFKWIDYRYKNASSSVKGWMYKMAGYLNREQRISFQSNKKYDLDKCTVKGFGAWLAQNRERIEEDIYKYLHSNDNENENEYDYGRTR